MQKEWTHTANGRDKDEVEAEVKRPKGRKGGRGEGVEGSRAQSQCKGPTPFGRLGQTAYVTFGPISVAILSYDRAAL